MVVSPSPLLRVQATRQQQSGAEQRMPLDLLPHCTEADLALAVSDQERQLLLHYEASALLGSGDRVDPHIEVGPGHQVSHLQSYHSIADVLPDGQFLLVRLFASAAGSMLDVGPVLAGKEPLDSTRLLGEANQADLLGNSSAAEARDNGVGILFLVRRGNVFRAGHVADHHGYAVAFPFLEQVCLLLSRSLRREDGDTAKSRPGTKNRLGDVGSDGSRSSEDQDPCR